MNKTIREASTYLTGLLPLDSENFSSEDLLRFGMPDFVVRRIKMEMADRLAASLAMPSTEWLDGNRESVRKAWMHFKRDVAGEAQLPRRHAAEIIDNAVIETVELIITPRRRVVEWIFGHAQEVTISTVRERSAYITVNRYLTDALIRYMERKDMHSITRVAAAEVVQTVDDRYISGFMPLSWAQLVDPLFQLARNRVDSDLIHDFFIDKGREDLAALFPETPIRIERVQFIEKLTIGPVSKPAQDIKPTPKVKPAPIVEPIAATESVLEIESELEMEPSEDVSAALAPEPAMPPEPEPVRLIEELHAPAEVPAAVPIWQQFLNDIPETFDDAEVDSEPAVVPETIQSVGLQRAKLVDWLKPDENAYIDGLFDGNEFSYFQKVAELESCSDWGEVQGLLKDWVKVSRIDLHNADLAQLVDQLQTYFSTNDI